MPDIWVVTADSSRARIFSTPYRNGKLVEQFDYVNPEARMHERELSTDLAGRTRNSTTGIHHSYGPDENFKPHAAELFAKQVSRSLADARKAGKFRKLYVVADPGFLGMLRQSLDPDTAKLVAGEVPKNVTRNEPEQVRRVLPDFL